MKVLFQESYLIFFKYNLKSMNIKQKINMKNNLLFILENNFYYKFHKLTLVCLFKQLLYLISLISLNNTYYHSMLTCIIVVHNLYGYINYLHINPFYLLVIYYYQTKVIFKIKCLNK